MKDARRRPGGPAGSAGRQEDHHRQEVEARVGEVARVGEEGRPPQRAPPGHDGRAQPAPIQAGEEGVVARRVHRLDAVLELAEDRHHHGEGRSVADQAGQPAASPGGRAPARPRAPPPALPGPALPPAAGAPARIRESASTATAPSRSGRLMAPFGGAPAGGRPPGRLAVGRPEVARRLLQDLLHQRQGVGAGEGVVDALVEGPAQGQRVLDHRVPVHHHAGQARAPTWRRRWRRCHTRTSGEIRRTRPSTPGWRGRGSSTWGRSSS